MSDKGKKLLIAAFNNDDQEGKKNQTAAHVCMFYHAFQY